jgi:hypothetical protein
MTNPFEDMPGSSQKGAQQDSQPSEALLHLQKKKNTQAFEKLGYFGMGAAALVTILGGFMVLEACSGSRDGERKKQFETTGIEVAATPIAIYEHPPGRRQFTPTYSIEFEYPADEEILSGKSRISSELFYKIKKKPTDITVVYLAENPNDVIIKSEKHFRPDRGDAPTGIVLIIVGLLIGAYVWNRQRKLKAQGIFKHSPSSYNSDWD